MGRKINHKVFGEIEYDYGWTKAIQLEFFGQKYEMQIVIDAEEDADFEIAQIESYKNFFLDINKRINDAEEAVFNYYQKESLNYREQFMSEEDRKKFVPEITKKEEVYFLVTPKQIMFPMVFADDKREAGFLCECTWEIEHGLGIKFEDEIVTEVGFQDILL
ncbi:MULTISPECIES: DUF6985 domain-containing protein [Listeria]|uniref:DUF6985 domain-containing protein n=1 Tax=Listeria TaxID=1637 RepID=UPI000B58937A|nr:MULTISPECIES: hypothetical protein [Listeria]